MTDQPSYTDADIVWGRIEAIRRRQRARGYTLDHDIEHVSNHPHVCIGLVAQYMAAGRWDDAAAMAVAFAAAAYVLERNSGTA